jgi:16S rRNA (uracil1498-N3)-methyltransferase
LTRIVVSKINLSLSSIVLGSEYNRYLLRVLRLKPGDEITVLDGRGKEAQGIIQSFDKRSVKIRLQKVTSKKETKSFITLIQSIPRLSKMDLIIRSTTELGVDRIIPVFSERSNIRRDSNLESRIQRWQKIAQEATRQSGRIFVPKILDPISFEQALKISQNAKIKIILWEQGDKMISPELKFSNKVSPLSIAIGPEGGFTSQEITLAQKAGFIPISLGQEILRTETAAIVSIGIFKYLRSSSKIKAD